MRIDTLAVVGVGLIGGSVGLAARSGGSLTALWAWTPGGRRCGGR